MPLLDWILLGQADAQKLLCQSPIRISEASGWICLFWEMATGRLYVSVRPDMCIVFAMYVECRRVSCIPGMIQISLVLKILRLLTNRTRRLLSSSVRLAFEFDKNSWYDIILCVYSWRCWLGGRKGIQPVKNFGVVRCWLGYLSGARCRLAYGPADATATHCLLLQWNPDWFYLSGTSSPG